MEDSVVHSSVMGKSLKMLERMVNQNREDEIYQDFKYWEDASDEFRDGEGSLLPLWNFKSERSKRKQVTAIAWHPVFHDMFAVGFGSYDFMHQSGGLVYCYSLKNTSNPEFTFSTESGVMCLDFHPQHQELLAVGCYNGNVLIYDSKNIFCMSHSRLFYFLTLCRYSFCTQFVARRISQFM
jgi:dynein intermediate chain 1